MRIFLIYWSQTAQRMHKGHNEIRPLLANFVCFVDLSVLCDHFLRPERTRRDMSFYVEYAVKKLLLFGFVVLR
jgi:hypothetical protein